MEDNNGLFTCIAFDPGGTTGWALLSCYAEAVQDPGFYILDNIVFWACGQYTGPARKQAHEMMELVEAWPRDSAIVSEDFLLRQFRMDRTLLDPVRINERFDQLLYEWDTEYLREVNRLARAADRYGERFGEVPPTLVGPPVPRTVFLQQPSMAMTTMTDARLKLAEESVAAGRGVTATAGGGGTRGFGFYSATAGRPHARDALRHAFTFVRRERAARLGKPPTSLYLPNWAPAPGA